MGRKLKRANRLFGSGNAGLASNFMDLGHSKLRDGGVLALVVPFAFVRGRSWKRARQALRAHYDEVHVTSIAATGQTARAFSAGHRHGGMSRRRDEARRGVQRGVFQSDGEAPRLFSKPRWERSWRRTAPWTETFSRGVRLASDLGVSSRRLAPWGRGTYTCRGGLIRSDCLWLRSAPWLHGVLCIETSTVISQTEMGRAWPGARLSYAPFARARCRRGRCSGRIPPNGSAGSSCTRFLRSPPAGRRGSARPSAGTARRPACTRA